MARLIRAAARAATGLRSLAVDRRGQALVEFALVMPIMLGFVIGIVELGQAWRTQQVLTHAVRESARVATVPNSTSAQVRESLSRVMAQGGLNASQAQLSLALRAGTGTLDTVKVQYPYAFPLLGPVVRLVRPTASAVPPGSIQLSSTYVMRNE